ncbi:hypothetical protein SAMN02910456_02411 [Ruminococcaceae bacterium YRB3002]|nr:hypothetical protein SAMN02910456_02411 [Ruminococcaceae bacterium YRB3002]
MRSKIYSSLALLLIAGLALSSTACSLFTRSPEQIEKANKEAMQMLKDKADEYGLDPECAEVLEGGTYYKVLIDTPKTVEEMDDFIVMVRKWLRFGYGELGRRYSIVFYDKNMPDLSYCGISDQDFGYPNEYLWSDYYIAEPYISKIGLYSSPTYKKNPTTPEEFYEVTGIDSSIAEELRKWNSSTFIVESQTEIDKDEHDIAFIPGDTIMHYEVFKIGDDDCAIKPGTYTVDMTRRNGVIHITDADGNFKYRLYEPYRDGKNDGLYEYNALPAIVELNEGDVVYMTNTVAVFDLV